MKGSFRIPSPALVVATLALVVGLGGVAVGDEVARVAATITGENIKNGSVSSADVKNNSLSTVDVLDGGLQSADIGSGQVRTSDLADDSVRGDKIAAGTVGGSDVDESSLGVVPDAARLGGRSAGNYITDDEVVPFRVALNFGEKVEFLSNGPVGLEADCRENIGAQGQDELRLLAVSHVDGSFMQGDTPHSGPGVGSNHLNEDTPEDNRTMGGIVSTQAGEGQPAAEDDIDTGFVAGPAGQYIGIDETTAYMLHVGGADCMLVGAGLIR